MTSKAAADERECSTVHAPIDRLGQPGRWLRKTFLEWSLQGMQVLVAVQNRRSKFWSTFFKLAQFLGEEDFYTVFNCFLIWVVDQKLAFLFGILLCLGFYFCNTLKNTFRLPRPAVPPVKPLHVMHDWSFPSHHSVNAVAMPWYIYFYSLDNYDLGTTAVLALFAVTSLWSCTVLYDRIYLGVHSPADVVAGGLLGVTLLAVFRFCQLDTFIDNVIVHSMSSVLYLVPLWIVFLAIVHPDSGYPTLTRSESTCMLGIAQGFTFANWPITSMFAPFPALLEQGLPDMSWPALIACALLRIVVGMAALLMVRVCLKAIFRPISKALMEAVGMRTFVSSKLAHTTVTFYNKKTYTLPDSYEPVETVMSDGSDGSDSLPEVLRNRPYSPDFTDTHFDSDIPMRIVVYTAIGWAGLEGIPYLFHCLGI